MIASSKERNDCYSRSVKHSQMCIPYYIQETILIPSAAIFYEYNCKRVRTFVLRTLCIIFHVPPAEQIKTATYFYNRRLSVLLYINRLPGKASLHLISPVLFRSLLSTSLSVSPCLVDRIIGVLAWADQL